MRAYLADAVFNGREMRPGAALVVDDGAVLSVGEAPAGVEVVELGPGVLAPGFVDLQVNGGGGMMFNDDPSVAVLERIASAHLSLGTTALLPTLVTDTPERTVAAVEAAVAAVEAGVPGIVGLHLEGPHLSVAKKGAHDPALIRPMEEADLALVLEAAARLPSLLVTVAPESVSAEQIARMAAAGVVVSLGHTDAEFETCRAAAAAGATCVTHLFNAMRQMGSREPGVVGAALAEGGLSAGLIADGHHVHPAVMRAALAAKTEPGEVFLVTDAMAVAGSDAVSFTLNGREIRRSGGRLTLADGTLAGADLEMAQAVRVMVEEVGQPWEKALAMATEAPARVIGREAELGCLRAGGVADFVWLTPEFGVGEVWKGGARV